MNFGIKINEGKRILSGWHTCDDSSARGVGTCSRILKKKNCRSHIYLLCTFTEKNGRNFIRIGLIDLQKNQNWNFLKISTWFVTTQRQMAETNCSSCLTERGRFGACSAGRRTRWSRMRTQQLRIKKICIPSLEEQQRTLNFDWPK